MTHDEFVRTLLLTYPGRVWSMLSSSADVRDLVMLDGTSRPNQEDIVNALAEYVPPVDRLALVVEYIASKADAPEELKRDFVPVEPDIR